MIVFNNVLCFVVLLSLPGSSATANFSEFRGITVISMIVLNNVLCFVNGILPSLSVDSATAYSAEFCGNPVISIIVFNNVLCFVICSKAKKQVFYIYTKTEFENTQKKVVSEVPIVTL